MKKILLTLIFILLHSTCCLAQWTQTSGPGGADVYSMYVDGNNLWLGTGQGVYLSTNNGLSWVKRSNGISNNNSIYSIFVYNGYVFISQYSYGLYCSSNMGMSWYSCNNGIQNYQYIYSLQAINNNLLCGGNFNGIYLSSNNGNNWYMTSGASNYTRAMLISNNIVFAGGNNAVYKSTDYGFSWNPGNGINSGNVMGLAMIGSNLFALTQSNIYMSTDNGSNWVSRYNTSSVLICLAAQGTNLYLGTYNGIEKSTDFGSTWNFCNSGIYATNTLTITASGNYIYSGFANRGGVFFTSDQGNSWAPRNNNLPNLVINDLCVNGNNMYAASQFVGVHVTTNNGDNWNIIYPSLPATSYSAVISIGNYVFAGYNSIYRSTNNGINWSPVYTGTCNALAINSYNNFVFAGVNTSIIRSSDFGVTWISSTSPPIYSFAFSGSSVFAGASSGQILYSSDNGYTWSVILNGNYGIIKGLAFYNNTLFAGASNIGVLKSSDMGLSWIICNNGLASTSISHLLMYQQHLFVTSDNIYYSSNYGVNWSIVSYGLSGTIPNRLAVSPPYLYAGTNGLSVWKRALSEIVGINNEPENIPASINLYQNYPNPFNPTTKIKFDVGKVDGRHACHIQLVIYDILGCEVATLVNEKLSPGTYEVEWNGSNYPSGIYFYKLTVGDPETSSGLYFTQTKKLILLR